MKDFPWRVIVGYVLGYVLGCALAVVVGVNWPDAYRPAVGSLIVIFVGFGSISAGMWWELRHDDRLIGGER